MAGVVYGVAVLLISVALVVAVGVYRRRRFVDVWRQDGGKLLGAAEVVVVGCLVAAFVAPMAINNRWFE
jgi:hypothetical protein